MKSVLLTTWAVTAVISAASAAQFPPPGGPRAHAGFGPGGFAPGMHPGKVVSGAPYTATATNTFTQTLANGNTIQRTTTATVARDNSGRTYVQQTITGGPLASTNGPATFTFINDPVAGYSYVLDANTKVATRRPLHTPPPDSENTPWHSNKPPHPNITENELGAKTINGLTVTGRSLTHNIPAGEIGNAQPITATTETWYSPDLQVVVTSTRNDPRTGTNVYALTNIVRQDPPAAWFQVPPDYAIEDARSFRRGPHGPAPPQ